MGAGKTETGEPAALILITGLNPQDRSRSLPSGIKKAASHGKRLFHKLLVCCANI